jgi:LEA14-like dessication related protein
MPILHEPAITLEGVKIRALSLSDLHLDVTIRVENLNPVGVTLKEIPFIVLIREGERQQEIANGNTGNVAIPAQSCTQLAVPVTSRNAVLVGAMGALVASGRIEVTIKGAAVVDAVIITWTVPFEKTIAVTMEQVAEALNAKYHEENLEQNGSGS